MRMQATLISQCVKVPLDYGTIQGCNRGDSQTGEWLEKNKEWCADCLTFDYGTGNLR
jgi:hypothetical protein